MANAIEHGHEHAHTQHTAHEGRTTRGEVGNLLESVREEQVSDKG